MYMYMYMYMYLIHNTILSALKSILKDKYLKSYSLL